MAIGQKMQVVQSLVLHNKKVKTIIPPTTKLKTISTISTNIKEPSLPFEICASSKNWQKPSKLKQSKRMWGDEHSINRYGSFYNYDKETFLLTQIVHGSIIFFYIVVDFQKFLTGQYSVVYGT